MKASAIPFILIVVAYFGLEVYVASRNAYRMEPEFIFGQFVGASQAVGRCGPLKAVESAKFDANYRYARRRAASAIAEERASDAPAVIEGIVREQGTAGQREVDALTDELGCDDIELFKLRKRYENLTRLNLPTTDADWSGGT